MQVQSSPRMLQYSFRWMQVGQLGQAASEHQSFEDAISSILEKERIDIVQNSQYNSPLTGHTKRQAD